MKMPNSMTHRPLIALTYAGPHPQLPDWGLPQAISLPILKWEARGKEQMPYSKSGWGSHKILWGKQQGT